MTDTVRLSTQGISDDWLSANGDPDTKFRGMLTREHVVSALHHLSPLDLPDGAECPPHIIIEGASEPISFIGQGGAIECLEAEADVTPDQGAALAFDEISIQSFAQADAPPPPSIAPPPPPIASKKTKHPAKEASRSAPRPQSKGMKAAGFLGAIIGGGLGGGVTDGSESAAIAANGVATGVAMGKDGKPVKGLHQKNTWRQYILYIIASLFMIGALLSVIGVFAASNSEGKMAAGLGILFCGGIGWGIIYAARKQRPWTDEDGNIYTGLMMAEMMNFEDFSDDGLD